jgi:hypothetical protein
MSEDGAAGLTEEGEVSEDAELGAQMVGAITIDTHNASAAIQSTQKSGRLTLDYQVLQFIIRITIKGQHCTLKETVDWSFAPRRLPNRRKSW